MGDSAGNREASPLNNNTMAASIAPECNDIKEWARYYRWDDKLLTVNLENMTLVSSSGTVRVCLEHPSTWGWFLLTYEEYLRGKTSSNECEDLFSKYKTCLNVCDHFSMRQFLVNRSQRALKEKGIEGMVEEARRNNRESDTDFLRKE